MTVFSRLKSPVIRFMRLSNHKSPLLLRINASESHLKNQGFNSLKNRLRLRPDPIRQFSSANAAQDTQDRDKQPVLVSRVSEDYVENTLTPHLEGQIVYNIHVYGPLELSRIARGYSMLPIRQKILCQKLSEQIKFRMIMFSGMSLVETIGAMWVLLPEDEELFEMLGERIVDVLDDFNALNLIGIIRVYNKLQHFEILSILVPRLQELLKEYDDAELLDMLVSLAHAGTAVQDMDVLVCLVPEILRRFDHIPLQVKLTHLWCMTKLRIIHEGMLSLCAKDLQNPMLTRGMPPAQICRVLWIFARSGALEMVLPAMEPLLLSNTSTISAADFARLSQVLCDTKSSQKGEHVPGSMNFQGSDTQVNPVAGHTVSDATVETTNVSKKSSTTNSLTSESDSTTKEVKCKLTDRQQAMNLLQNIADRLQVSGISCMGRKEVILYLLATVRADILQKDDVPDLDLERTKPLNNRRSDKLYQIFAYFYEEQDNFERDEIERIVTALWFHEDYRNLIDSLPKSWTTFVDEILVALEARAEETQQPDTE